MKKIYVCMLIALVFLLCGCSEYQDESEEYNTSEESTENVTESNDYNESKEDVRTLEYKDGYAIVTYDNLPELQEKDDFTDVYVEGKIDDIIDLNVIIITDSTGGKWSVDIGTDRDLYSYIGTSCEVYGFSTGGISSQYETPFINMSHEDNHIVFNDSKTLYPEDYDSVQQFTRKNFENDNNGGEGMVWIPTDGGTKYHCDQFCSGMSNPKEVTEAEAISQGYSQCGKCW